MTSKIVIQKNTKVILNGTHVLNYNPGDTLEIFLDVRLTDEDREFFKKTAVSLSKQTGELNWFLVAPTEEQAIKYKIWKKELGDKDE